MLHRLSGRQRAIMRVLWERKEGTVADVQQGLASPLAYTTVATVLARLERRGLVRHRVEGRTFVYLPALTEDAVDRSAMGNLVETVFGGNPVELVSQLLDSEYVDAAELAKIKELVLRSAAKGGRRGR